MEEFYKEGGSDRSHHSDFGNNKPAHGDYTIRSIDVIQLRHIESALWQLQSDARTLFWNAWLKLMHDAGKAMIDDHPLRSPSGHHIINAEFFPLVFSAFGSMAVGVHVLLKRVRKARAHLQAKLLRDTLATALVRQIAFRIRTGAGKADDVG